MKKIYPISLIIAIIITFLFLSISQNVVYSEERFSEGIFTIGTVTDLPTSKLSMGWPLPMYQKYEGGMPSPSQGIRDLFFMTRYETIEIYWTNIIAQSSVVFLISFAASIVVINKRT